MRKSLWLVAVVLLSAAICAPIAHADSMFVYTYTLTSPGYDLTWTTQPVAAVTGATIIPAADLASYSVTGSAWSGYSLFSGDLDIPVVVGGQGVQDTEFTVAPSLCPNCFLSSIFNPNEALPLSDYSTPGTYTSTGTIQIMDYVCCGASFVTGTDILTVSPVVATPEPSSAVLMVPGILLLLFVVMRKRFAFHSLPQATFLNCSPESPVLLGSNVLSDSPPCLCP